MEGYGEGVVDFEGMHFLAALDADPSHSDGDADSWDSSECEDDLTDEQFKISSKAKRFCAPIKWVDKEINAAMHYPFIGNSGMRFSVENPEPSDIFQYFCRTEFLSALTAGTNAYATQLQRLGDPMFASWKPLTLPEMSSFLGLLYHTGTIRMNNISDYWSTNKLFDLKIFRTTMTETRFSRILTALRFERGSVPSYQSENKVLTISPLIDYFNNAMECVCTPGRELVVDDCMVVVDNNVVSKKGFNPTSSKPEVFLHLLSEPHGLVHKIFVTEQTPQYMTALQSLVEGKTNKGHSIFLDSKYCSIPFVHEMILNKTYCTGILDCKSKLIPDEVLCVKLSKGEPPIVRYTEPGICIIKWKNKEEIIAISSEFKVKKEYGYESQEVEHKPLIIKEYRKIVCRTDRKEPVMSYRPLEGVNVGWYRSVTIYILQLMMRHSYLLYNNYVKKKTFHDFRLSVIENLLKKDTRLELIPSNLPVAADDALHVPRKFPKRQGQRSLRKRCKVCLRDGKRTDSYYHCPQCPNLPALCLEKCFAEYHNVLKIKIEKEKEASPTP